MARKKYGRVFRTRAGRLGRYVYVGGRRVAFETYRAARNYRRAEMVYKTAKRARKAYKTYRKVSSIPKSYRK